MTASSLRHWFYCRYITETYLYRAFKETYDAIIDKSRQPQKTSNWFYLKTDQNKFGKTGLKGVTSFYLWGGTGCGKTFVMDLFYSCLPLVEPVKKRVHFHDFMLDLHKRIHLHKMSPSYSTGKGKNENVINKIADELLSVCRVICFDEFQVTDIADAVLLRSLFPLLLSEGLVLIVTSNRPPSDLYEL